MPNSSKPGTLSTTWLKKLSRNSLTKGKAPARTFENYVRHSNLERTVRLKDYASIPALSEDLSNPCFAQMTAVFDCWRRTDFESDGSCTKFAADLTRCAEAKRVEDPIPALIRSEFNKNDVTQNALRNYRKPKGYMWDTNAPKPQAYDQVGRG